MRGTSGICPNVPLQTAFCSYSKCKWSHGFPLLCYHLDGRSHAREAKQMRLVTAFHFDVVYNVKGMCGDTIG